MESDFRRDRAWVGRHWLQTLVAFHQRNICKFARDCLLNWSGWTHSGFPGALECLQSCGYTTLFLFVLHASSSQRSSQDSTSPRDHYHWNVCDGSLNELQKVRTSHHVEMKLIAATTHNRQMSPIRIHLAIAGRLSRKRNEPWRSTVFASKNKNSRGQRAERSRWRLLRRASKQNCPSFIVLPLLYSAAASARACTHELWAHMPRGVRAAMVAACETPRLLAASLRVLRKKEQESEPPVYRTAINHKFGRCVIPSGRLAWETQSTRVITSIPASTEDGSVHRTRSTRIDSFTTRYFRVLYFW